MPLLGAADGSVLAICDGGQIGAGAPVGAAIHIHVAPSARRCIALQELRKLSPPCDSTCVWR